jgi:hypothetical protein
MSREYRHFKRHYFRPRPCPAHRHWRPSRTPRRPAVTARSLDVLRHGVPSSIFNTTNARRDRASLLVARTLWIHEPAVMIRVLLVGFILTALTVIIHGLGTLTLSVDLVRLWAEKKDRGRPFTVELLIVRLVSGLLVLHQDRADWRARWSLPGHKTAL